MWQQTGGCKADGTVERSNNKACTAAIHDDVSGFCICETSADGTYRRVNFDCAPNARTTTTCNDACGVPPHPATPQKDAATMYPPGTMTGGIPTNQGSNAAPGISPAPYRLISLAAAASTRQFVTLCADAGVDVYAAPWTPGAAASERTDLSYANNLWRNIQVSWEPPRFLVQHLASGLFLTANPEASVLNLSAFTPADPGMFIFGTNWGDRGIFFCSPGQAYRCGSTSGYNGGVNNVMGIGASPQTLSQAYAPISSVLAPCNGDNYDPNWPYGGTPFLRIATAPSSDGTYTVSLAGPSNPSQYISTRQNDPENDWYMLIQYGLRQSSAAPVTHGWSLAAFLNRSAADDYNAPFNVSRTALATRFREPRTQTNPDQTDKPQVCIAFNCSSVDYLLQGSQQFNSFNFKFWQYADAVIYDGGDQGLAPPESIHLTGDGGAGSPAYTGPLHNFLDGARPGAGTRVWIPPPALINTAHLNGVRCYGYIGFQELYYGGKFAWWRQFLQDPIAMAHALVDSCIYYGHDGFFINYESNVYQGETPAAYTFTGNPDNETARFVNDPSVDPNLTPENYLYDPANYWCHYDPHAQGTQWWCNVPPCRRCDTVELPDYAKQNAATRAALIILLKEVNRYRTEKAYPNASVIWYESIAPNGEVNYYGGINSNNLDLWVDEDGVVADYMFTMIPGGGIFSEMQAATYQQSSEAARGVWPKNTGPANTDGQCLHGPTCVPMCGESCNVQSPYAAALPPDRPYDFFATLKLGEQGSGDQVLPIIPFHDDTWTDRDNVFHDPQNNKMWAPRLYMGAQPGNNAGAASIAPLTSLGIYDAASLFNPASSQEFYDLKEQLMYVSSTGWCGENDASPYDPAKSKGLSHYVTERSVVTTLPFCTFFCTGAGKQMWIQGRLQPNFGSWVTFQQDLLPTWRWWPLQKDTIVRPSISYARSFNGGSSLVFEAAAGAAATDFLLYKTNLDTSGGLAVTVVFACEKGQESRLRVGYSLVSGLSTSTSPPAPPVAKQALGVATQEGWNTVVVNIPARANDAVAILWISTDAAPAGFRTWVGKLLVDTANAKRHVAGLSAIRVTNVKTATHTGLTSLNLEWDAPKGGVAHYNVYANDRYLGSVSGGGAAVRQESLTIPVLFNVQNLRAPNSRFTVQQVATTGDVSDTKSATATDRGATTTSATRTAGWVSLYVGVGGVAAVVGAGLVLKYAMKRSLVHERTALIISLTVSLLLVALGLILIFAIPEPRARDDRDLVDSDLVVVDRTALSPKFSVIAVGKNTPELVEARRVVTAEAQRLKDLVLALPSTAVTQQLADAIFKTYSNTMVELTTQPSRDRTYVLTGGWGKEPPGATPSTLMGGMWIRDSCAAFHSYIPLAAKGSRALQLVLEGHIRQCADFIIQDGYANAFNESPSYHDSWVQGHNGYVATRNYEPDSLCYFLWQAHRYWVGTGRTAHFDDLFKIAADKIVVQLTIEQHRAKFQDPLAEWCNKSSSTTGPYTVQSVYRFNELANGSVGSFVGDPDRDPVGSGMTWTAFRPSDNQALYGFNVPNNMFAVEALRGLGEILARVPQYARDLKAQQIASNAFALQGSLDMALVRHATYNYPGLGLIYAFEVDAMAVSRPMIADGRQTEFVVDGPYVNDQLQLRSTPGGLKRTNCGDSSGLTGNIRGDPACPLDPDLPRETLIGPATCNSGVPIGDGTTLESAGGTLYVEVLVDGIPAPFDGYSTTAKSVIFNAAPPKNAVVRVRGNFNLMDDANVPSLLSIPYLGYSGAAWDPVVYANTRQFCLSERNRWYYGGSTYPSSLGYAGIGSNHTFLSAGEGLIWPMALAVQGLTSADVLEKRGMVKQLLGSMAVGYTSGSQLLAPNLMHESFHLQDPTIYTRGSFGWANALFAELVASNESIITLIIPATAMPKK